MNKRQNETNLGQEIITREIPSLEPLRLLTLASCPLVTISQGREVQITPDCDHSDSTSNLEAKSWAEVGCDKVENGGKGEDGEVERGEVVMKEELTRHQEEGEVVQSPTHDEETGHVVIFDDGGYRSKNALVTSRKVKHARWR